jgi:HTH-type transcriptional regulator / antitoxin HigA
MTAIKSDDHLARSRGGYEPPASQRGTRRWRGDVSVDALSDLVGAYEDKHYPIAPASDADMLRHFMEAKGTTQAELSRETTIAKSTISEVLAGKKPFSRQMIHRFADYFKVDVAVLGSHF